MLDQLCDEAARIKPMLVEQHCERCNGPLVGEWCGKCGTAFERFSRTWAEAMATSAQRLDAAAVRHLMDANDEASYVELTEALRNWVEARRMR